MRILCLIFFLLFSFTFSFAQKEWSNWYFNGRNLLTFKNGKAEIVQNFIPPSPDLFSFYVWGSGGISYSDPITGEMKFIISNRLGFNKDYTDFPNDNFIRSCPDKYSYHIIPFNNNPNKFYVIQFQDYTHDLAAKETGLQVRCPNAIGLGYSIVDLSLDGGLGDFSLVNQIITAPLASQITTVRHANGKDVWIIVHQYNSDKYQSILVTDGGIQPAIESTVGPVMGPTSLSIRGILTASHDGKILAGVSVASGPVIQLYDFNNSTGKLSNYRTLPFFDSPGPLQFSPDNSKLYCLRNNAIYQFDFNNPDISSTLTKIAEQPNAYMFDMQLGPDGKIYICKTIALVNNQYEEFTGAIECPNLPQFACNFNPTALNSYQVTFPDLINDFINDPKAPPVTKFNLGNDTSVCFGNYKITAPAGWESYKWSTGETTREITINKAGLYYVLSGNTGFSCPQGYGYINVSDKAIKLNLGKDTSVCPKSSYSLQIDRNYTNVLWQNGSSTYDSVITSTSSIIISANDPNGCFTSDTINVYYKNLPRAEFGPPDTIFCTDQSLLLQLEPKPNPFETPAIFLWQNGSTKDTLRINQPGTFWGRVTYQGCTVSDTITVSLMNTANVSLGRDTTLCSGDSLMLHTNITGGNFLWNTGETSSSITVKTSGTYWVSVNNGSCSAYDTINVTFIPKPALYLGTDTTICEKESLTLHATPNANYLWGDNSTKDFFIVTSPGNYWVKVTQNGCSISDTIYVNFRPVPPLNLGKDTGICNNQILLLNAENPSIDSYLWQDNSNQSTFTVTQAGIYYVTITGINTCKNYDTISIKQLSDPVVSLDHDSTLCAGTSRILNAGSFSSYLWNTGSMSQTITVNSTGIYSVIVTDNNKCKGSDTARITTMLAAPSGFLFADTAVCSYGSIQLYSTSSFVSYVWNTHAVTPSINITQPGLYWLMVKDKNNCPGRDSVIVAEKDCIKGFYIPNAFSPDGNGRNDTYRPMIFGKVKTYEFSIYNQFGELIFKTADLNKAWDGRYKGFPQDAGIFVWICRFQLENEPAKVEKGSVMLLR